MRGLLCGLALLTLLSGADPVATEPPQAEEKSSPKITDLNLEFRDGGLQVSFRLDGGLDPETRSRIASGLETTFDYRLEVLRKRRFWPDARVQDHRILTSVKFDSLSRQYGLTLKLDGEVERSSTTDRVDEMERWLTSVGGISLGAASEFLPAGDFSVRVKADFPLHFILLFIPWDRDTAWVRATVPAPPLSQHAPAQ